MYSKMFKPLTISLVLTAIVVMFTLTTADGWDARSICRGVVDEDFNPDPPCDISSETACSNTSYTITIEDETRDCYYGYPGYKCKKTLIKLDHGNAKCVWENGACTTGTGDKEDDFNDCKEKSSTRDA